MELVKASHRWVRITKAGAGEESEKCGIGSSIRNPALVFPQPQHDTKRCYSGGLKILKISPGWLLLLPNTAHRRPDFYWDQVSAEDCDCSPAVRDNGCESSSANIKQIRGFVLDSWWIEWHSDTKQIHFLFQIFRHKKFDRWGSYNCACCLAPGVEWLARVSQRLQTLVHCPLYKCLLF